jgi:hypothetical protein
MALLACNAFAEEATLRHLLGSGLLLGGAKECSLLLLGLELSVSKFGRSIDELEFDLLQSGALGLGNESLSQGDGSLLDANDAALDHEPVLVDLTVMGESTNGGDGLGSKIEVGGSVGHDRTVLHGGITDAVDLLVDLGTVMVTHLTSAGNRECHAGRMPGTDAGHLAQTTMGLTGQTGNSPTGSDTIVTFTFGDTDGIDHVVQREHCGDRDGLLKESIAEVNLLGDITTVDLNLHKVSLLLSELDLAHLGVSQDTNDSAVLLHALQLSLNVLVVGRGNLLGIAGEGLLLGSVPVLVESSLDVLRQMLSPDGSQSAKTARSLNVTDQANDLHGGALEDGDHLDDFLLVNLGTGLVHFTEDVSATSLVADEGGQVAILADVVLWERLNATSVVLAPLAGEKSQRPATGMFELTV